MASAQQTATRPIGRILIDQGLISDEQLQQALGAQEGSSQPKLLGELLVELGFCTEHEILQALSQIYDVPFVRLTPKLMDAAVASLVDRDRVMRDAVLPLFLVDNVLTVAMAEPENVFLVEELEQSTGHQIQIVASPRSDIIATAEAALQQHTTDARQIDEILSEIRDSGELRKLQALESENQEINHNDSPVVKLVHQLIVSAVREHASDIHFEPGDKVSRVRYRVDGRLYEKMTPPTAMNPPLVARLKILSGLDIAERRLPQDGAMRVVVDDRAVDLRVSTLPNRFGEKAVLRILDQSSAVIPLESLGMDATTSSAFTRQIRKPHGIVLVTGPTGSGKTTTLYASLNAISNPEVNICTVEDPVEYMLPGINQFQVHDSIGLSFPKVLRSLLRQDPDIIMVGEIRDAETANIATQAALTGHLVLSTLHTNDATSAVTRLENLGVDAFLIAASLEAVLAQRLLRKICTNCKIETKPPAHLQPVLERIGETVETVFQGRGCMKCHQIGARGRVGAYEHFEVSDEIRNAIASQRSSVEIRQLAVKLGMSTLLSSALGKARSGETTYEEVLRVTIGSVQGD